MGFASTKNWGMIKWISHHRTGEMLKFREKRVVITGASRGIGAHLASHFGQHGAHVAVNYSGSRDAAEAVVAEIKSAGGTAFAIRADIGSKPDVDAMFAAVSDQMGGVDILINNAGLNRDGPLVDMSEADWDAVANVNMKGPFLCSQAAARLMPQSGGRIVNISAVTALLGRANAANYSASKAGLNALTRSLAVELGPAITANAIALGFFDSPLVRDIFSPEQIAAVEEKLPVGRMGHFSEVAALVDYLVSEPAGFLTGEVISLDGGQRMSLG